MITLGDHLAPEQRVAVQQRDGPMLLSANAGSGKTTVLVERFVAGVLEDGLEPARLLAITFTDKAAGELRSRIRARLVTLGHPAAARDLEGAWISTIHGFCTRVLRAHAVAAGLDPRFEVLDESATRGLQARAFETALAAFLTRPGALDLAAGWGADRLETAIGAVHDTLRSQGQTHPRLPSPRPRGDVASACERLRRATGTLQGELAGARSIKSIDRARAVLDSCAAALAGEPSEAAWSFPRNSAELRTDATDAWFVAVSALAAALEDREAVSAHALLDGLLADHADAYAQAKRERSGVDFEDLELRTRDLFAAAPAIAAGYRERFDRIMVDEFQDTNRLQLALLEQLDRGNAFLVGDELQSIYGFRHADVEVFRAERAEHTAQGLAPVLATNWRSAPAILETINGAWGAAHPGYVPLVPGREPVGAEPAAELLLASTEWDGELEGRLADELAAGMPTGVKASKLAEARAVARRLRALVDAGETRPQDIAVLLRAATDLHVFERALEREGFTTLAAGGRGYWLRQPVQDLLSYLAALANPRDELALYGTLASPLCGLSSDGLAHVAALVRERSRAPAAADAGAALSAGASPSADAGAAPAGVAGSVVGSPPAGSGASPPMLAGAATAAATPSPGSAGLADRGVWAALHAPELPARLSAADATRLSAFLPRFAAERTARDRHSLDALLERAVTQSGYDLHVLRLPGGRRRLANVHKLLRLAAAFEAAAGRDVRGFIDHAQAEVDAEAREAEAPVELGDQEAIRLMSVHAAKGLEFGTVVVADLGRGRRAQTPDLLVDGDRVGLRLVRLGAKNARALDYDALAAAARTAESEEERRILHVAFTRAEERLILSGVARVGEEAEWPKEGSAASPLSWVGRGLDPALPAGLAEEPHLTIDRDEGVGRIHLAARLVAPATAAATLGLTPPAPAGAQLDLFGAAASAPPAADALAPLLEAGLTAALTDPAAGLDVPAHSVAAAARAWLDATAAGTASAPDAAERRTPAPGTLSYSQLSLHARCGYRWYLERVLRLPSSAAGAPVPAVPPPPGPTLDPRARGTLAHWVLEELDPAAPVAPTAAALQELAEERGGFELGATDADELHRLLDGFATSSPLLPRLAAATRVRTEASFALPLAPDQPGAPLLQGVVDVLAEEADGRMLVVDWKTDRLAGAEPEALVADHYGIQRRLYALAALATGAPRVEVAYAFLERPEPLRYLHAPADAAALRDDVLRAAAPLLAGEHRVAPEPHLGLCAGCPGRGGLCSHPLEHTDRVLAGAWPPPPAAPRSG